MKNLRALLYAIFIVLFVSCASDETPTENGEITGEVTARNYYPGGIGSSFNYRSDTLNIATGKSGTTSTRRTEISDFTILGDTIFTQNTEVEFENLGVNNVELDFRRTDFGIYIQIDSIGIFDSLNINDSLNIVNIDFKIDDEFIALSYPFFPGKFWFAFLLQVSVQGSPFFPIVTIKANYQGEEEIFVEAVSANRVAEKIKYTTDIVLPDLSDSTGTSVTTQEFITNAWYVKNIGLVRLEGSNIIQGILTGVISLPTNSTTMMIDELTSYEIK